MNLVPPPQGNLEIRKCGKIRASSLSEMGKSHISRGAGKCGDTRKVWNFSRTDVPARFGVHPEAPTSATDGDGCFASGRPPPALAARANPRNRVRWPSPSMPSGRRLWTPRQGPP